MESTSSTTGAAAQRAVTKLSPRLRQVLRLYLTGLGEDALARQLNLAQCTVHEYVGKLFEHYQVCSGRELMALFIPAHVLAEIDTPAPADPSNPSI